MVRLTIRSDSLLSLPADRINKHWALLPQSIDLPLKKGNPVPHNLCWRLQDLVENLTTFQAPHVLYQVSGPWPLLSVIVALKPIPAASSALLIFALNMPRLPLAPFNFFFVFEVDFGVAVSGLIGLLGVYELQRSFNFSAGNSALVA